MEDWYNKLSDRFRLQNLTFIFCHEKGLEQDIVSYNDLLEFFIEFFNEKPLIFGDDIV